MGKNVLKIDGQLLNKSTSKFMLTLPREIQMDLSSWAEKNARSLSDEIIARLNITLKNNERIMSHDRLMRLIYSKKLAYIKKVSPDKPTKN
ncbi:MAG: Arc family DNA-binding protein [Gammaproteobacteria bacterium]|nr:Arc family DNA-binding protein [Gammaproteobacteria bacterium]